MQVDVVRSLSALHELQADWTRVYAADPEGQFFLSWPWMSKRLERRPGWIVLVARPTADAAPVAFFPIRPRPRTDRHGHTHTELMMAGRGAADYTGFICEPGHDERAGHAFAAYLLGLDWQVLSLECLRASAQRMRGLLSVFAARRFGIAREPMVMSSGVDNAICPYADLPDSWDGYLAQLSANTRQRLRRLMRTLDGTTLRITHADASTLKRDIEILLGMWRERWASRKGDRLEVILSSSREELADALANDTLFLPILWRGDTPIGGAACMMDREKREMMFQLGARDPAAEDASPGMLLHAHSIRAAIELGFVRYDFLRGNEPYKYSFANAERRIESLVVRRASAFQELPKPRRAPDVVPHAAARAADTRPMPATCSAGACESYDLFRGPALGRVSSHSGTLTECESATNEGHPAKPGAGPGMPAARATITCSDVLKAV
ncbi:GNAT family N-acetyltransferase [Nannocystis punicea]|uniref:GNAT family N-acetyltransferase n=1 Tax=Nannocystis punicea TaxID=2995304 RepID=A0ABY7GWI6_9BACT|nr:GNAT family N-acetyltransferase [Nannocystis poenicansa]WAS91292.1 GNAT family N-acetyltransferase [Nannocystis poenicansa]